MALVGLFTGHLTWRRLLVLLRGLPPHSRLGASIDPARAWTPLEYLTAQAADNAVLVADELAAFRWLWTGAHLKKGATKPERPAGYPRLPRPGRPTPTTPQRRRMTPGEAARAWAGART